MVPSFEVLLVLGVVVLYLQDSLLLLHYDELVFTRAGRHWVASTGGSHWGGRYLHLGNPFTPARAMLRASWLSAETAGAMATRSSLAHFLDGLRPFRIGARVLWGELLVLLPLVLWALPHPLLVLAVFALVYATVAVLALQLWRWRRVLELRSRDVAALAFELLACPPHAINVVRRLSLRRGLGGDALAFAARAVAARDLPRLQAGVAARIQLASDLSADADPRRQALQWARERLGALVP
jgi:hypothetical protein